MHLAAAFDDRCGYGAMYERSGTVDHVKPVSTHEALAYEWQNYRYVSGWINSAKSKSGQVLDPCSVKAGWFKILLPSLQLVAVEANIPQRFRRRALDTVQNLHLAHDERILRQRREWLAQYESGAITLTALRRFAPLIAEAVEERDAAAAAAQLAAGGAPL